MGGGQGPEELPADVALEVAHDLAFGAAFDGAAGDVGPGAGSWPMRTRATV